MCVVQQNNNNFVIMLGDALNIGFVNQLFFYCDSSIDYHISSHIGFTASCIYVSFMLCICELNVQFAHVNEAANLLYALNHSVT